MEKIFLEVTDESDIAEAARCVRRFAQAVGFSKVDIAYVTTAASELAANLFFHAGGGVLTARGLSGHPGLELIADDQGPGIADLESALRDGYSTKKSLGCGLPGVKRLMDEMDIVSEPGKGTKIKVRKWC